MTAVPPETVPLQMTAFDDWTNALSLLHRMEQNEQNIPPQKPQELLVQSTGTMVQQLESMEQDDKSLSVSLEGVTPEKVEKPW